MTAARAQVRTAESAEPDHLSPLDSEMAGLSAQDAMEILCRSLAETVRVSASLPSKAVVRFGCASVEVEWPAADAGTGGFAEHRGGAVKAAGHEETEGLLPVSAPVVGTFYRAPEPKARPFVEVGDDIEVGQQIGIVEAMKLMNPIVAETAGTVVEILVGDAAPVEYGQPLLLVRPPASEA